jgi:hypothetical protein
MIARIINNTLRTRFKLINFNLSNGLVFFTKNKDLIQTNIPRSISSMYNFILHQDSELQRYAKVRLIISNLKSIKYKQRTEKQSDSIH